MNATYDCKFNTTIALTWILDIKRVNDHVYDEYQDNECGHDPFFYVSVNVYVLYSALNLCDNGDDDCHHDYADEHVHLPYVYAYAHDKERLKNRPQ